MIFIVRGWVPSIAGVLLNVIYAPLLIVFLVGIFNKIEEKENTWVLGIFSVLGKYSTGMWFFHAVFFSEYLSDVFQPILRWVKFRALMYIWCVLLSLLGAYFYQVLLDILQKIPKQVKRRT